MNDCYLHKIEKLKFLNSIKNIRKKSVKNYIEVRLFNLREKLKKFTSRGGYDVLSGSPSEPPLGADGRVDDVLRGGVGVHRGHQPLLHPEAVVHDFHQGRQRVGGARRARHDDVGFRVIWLVHAHHERRGVGRRRRYDDSFGATLCPVEKKKTTFNKRLALNKQNNY